MVSTAPGTFFRFPPLPLHRFFFLRFLEAFTRRCLRPSVDRGVPCFPLSHPRPTCHSSCRNLWYWARPWHKEVTPPPPRRPTVTLKSTFPFLHGILSEPPTYEAFCRMINVHFRLTSPLCAVAFFFSFLVRSPSSLRGPPYACSLGQGSVQRDSLSPLASDGAIFFLFPPLTVFFHKIVSGTALHS